MKNPNDTSWDRTSDLPICSTEHISIVILLNGKQDSNRITYCKTRDCENAGKFFWWLFSSVFVCLFVCCGSFAKFRTATVSFLMSVRMEQLTCRWTDFHEMGYLRILRKSVGKTPFLLKSDKNNLKTSVQYVYGISVSSA